MQSSIVTCSFFVCATRLDLDVGDIAEPDTGGSSLQHLGNVHDPVELGKQDNRPDGVGPVLQEGLVVANLWLGRTVDSWKNLGLEEVVCVHAESGNKGSDARDPESPAPVAAGADVRHGDGSGTRDELDDTGPGDIDTKDQTHVRACKPVGVKLVLANVLD